MIETFTQLFEESLKTTKIRPGSIIQGTVISIEKNMVLIDTGLKSESNIPIEQFLDIHGKLEIKIGDQIDVSLDAIEDGFGKTLLSREKAKRYEAWLKLEKAYETSSIIIGIINGKVKGGFTVELNGIRAFLPGSLVDVRPIKDSSFLEGKELEFKVIKLDKKRNNVVISRRAVIESVNNVERDELLAILQENMEIHGIVKNLTDYGAFIDLGGIDGLLHITDMSWKRVKHPNEIVNIGDKITVKVLKFDRERIRVSLGLKQLNEDPWLAIAKRFPEGTYLTGKVTNLTDYGCFVEIEEGIEGLVHISEMDWTNKNIHPSKVVNIASTVKVMVLDIDQEKRRISLGLKQCTINPWQQFSKTYHKGSCVEGKIKSITDFGLFIGLEGGIDGLVHQSDISWDYLNKNKHEYKKGDKITTVVLQVDVERERISLSIKQLVDDPFNKFLSLNKIGDLVTGKIKSIEKKGVTVELDNSIEGYLRINEDNYEHTENINFINKSYNIGDDIKANFLNVDRKNRIINLSIYKNNTNKIKTENLEENNKQNLTNISNVMTEAFKIAIKND